MKTVLLMLLSGVLALTACADKTPNLSTNVGVSNMSKIDLFQGFAMTEQYLVGTWQLKDNNLKGSDNQPLTLKFVSEKPNSGEVLVLNGCNNMRANYQIADNQLKLSSPISTRMACEENLMQIDSLASKLLAGRVGLEKFVDGLPEHSYLKITVDGKDYKFTRVK